MTALVADVRGQQRLMSLDVFRGFTMAAMVLVNNGGDGAHIYPQLAHAYWNGWTFTDWIFPFFLWISGMSTTYAVAARRSRGATAGDIFTQVLRRSAIIFLLGVFLNGFPFGLLGDSTFAFATWRIPGVLQRIAICYLLGSLLYLSMPSRKFWLIVLGLFISYWALMQFVPVPGVGAGSWERGRNFAAYVDELVIGSHAYMRTKPWDPEGIISTLPAIGTFLLGIMAGDYMRGSKASGEGKTSWLFISGSALLVGSVVLDMWIPINKRLWTPSYVLMMAGWAHLVFAFAYFLVDVKGYKKWTPPFLVFGMNAIFIYAVSSLLESLVDVIPVAGFDLTGAPAQVSLKTWLMQHFFSPVFSPYNASLAYALSFVLAMYFMGLVMWRKKWFVKI
jgi:predicted acyltransferase